MKVTWVSISWLIFWLFIVDALFFNAFTSCVVACICLFPLWHAYVYSRVRRSSKLMYNLLKKLIFWYCDKKKYFRSLIFINVTGMQTSWFIFWLFIVNAFFFQFFRCGIPVHISILTRVQNGYINCRKKIFLLKTVLFEAFFRTQRLLVCKVFVLHIDYLLKMSSFLALSYRMWMHSPILAAVQKGCYTR